MNAILSTDQLVDALLTEPRADSAAENRIREWLASNERRFTAEAKGQDLEISVMDVIGGGWFFEGVTAKSVKRALDSAPNAKTIRVLMNTPGGSAFDGLAIQALLKRHPARVEVEVLGWAASAGSVIAMAGDTIKMHEGSMMMIHRASTISWGNADDLRKDAEMLDKLDASIVDLYTRRTGKTRDEITDLVRAETWMTAQEAVDLGFATELLEGKAPAAPAKDAAKTEAKPAPGNGAELRIESGPPADVHDLSDEQLRGELARRSRMNASNHLSRAAGQPKKLEPIGAHSAARRSQ